MNDAKLRVIRPVNVAADKMARKPPVDLAVRRFREFRRCLASKRVLAPLLILGAGALLQAQQAPLVGGRSEVFADGELERYLRYLQTTGRVGEYPWTIRGFSPPEIDSLSVRGTHPWQSRYDLGPRALRHAFDFDVVRPTVSVRYNSAFPYGSNDGPIWAGRGVTTAVQAGIAVRWSILSIKIAPEVFRAENAAFPLMPNGQIGRLAFADRQYPFRVDRPQRFGNEPYTVFDPGESSLRLDSRLLTVGISTANQAWGPAEIYPFILGNNAAGFPHVFVGTGMPWNFYLFHFHARLVYGDLSQSGYSSVDSAHARRFMSGMVVTAQPRGINGLEIGAARFFHSPWPSSGLTWSDFRTPLEDFFKKSLSNSTGADDQSNQLASLFFRWMLPRSGFEVYSEFGREDHNWDLRDLILEPDHASTLTLGARKVWAAETDHMIGLRAETIDMRFNTLSRTRPIGAGYYVNGTIPQGHTERGQLLGADVTAGSGSGAVVALDAYSPRGRWTLSWQRTTIDTLGLYLVTGAQSPKAPEVQHAVGVETVRFWRSIDLRAGLTAIYDFNRYFTHDAFDLNAILGATWRW